MRHRLKPYAAGDPPVGMQPEHDAGTLSLDITLERFEVAREFLEKVLAGICDPLGIDLGALLTDGGRERLVLASGGVARDYLSLARRALRNATERPSHQWRVKNRITAGDVAQAAAALYEQKQDELKEDAREDAEALRSRLSEIVRFCVETHGTNVMLVETTKLQGESWGKDVQVLADLRFSTPSRHALNEARRRDLSRSKVRGLHARSQHLDQHAIRADQPNPVLGTRRSAEDRRPQADLRARTCRTSGSREKG